MLRAPKTAAEPLVVKQLRAEASWGGMGRDGGGVWVFVCVRTVGMGLVDCQGKEKCCMVPGLCLG